MQMSSSFNVVISGCSGGGKSTLLSELASRGFPTVPEPGRRIVQEELKGNGTALPWIDLGEFAMRAIRLASLDRTASTDSWTFFDRGLVDAAVALQQATGQSAASTLEQHPRYYRRVFFTPPWPEIYQTDAERRHGLDEAIAEYDRLLVAYKQFGYEPIILPKLSVKERADLVLDYLK